MMQGGCGCCTVMLSYYDQVDEKQRDVAINSCLRPLCSIDGMAVTTVEGLGNHIEGYHPIQQQLADNNGSQCGFCSPGMVMNMYSLLQNNPSPTKKQIEDHFDGNLCRCTGYRPILDAMNTFASDYDASESPCKRSGKETCKNLCSAKKKSANDKPRACSLKAPKSSSVVIQGAPQSQKQDDEQ